MFNLNKKVITGFVVFLLIAAIIAIAAVVKHEKSDTNTNTNTSTAGDNKNCEPKVVEKVVEKIVYKDKVCPTCFAPTADNCKTWYQTNFPCPTCQTCTSGSTSCFATTQTACENWAKDHYLICIEKPNVPDHDGDKPEKPSKPSRPSKPLKGSK